MADFIMLEVKVNLALKGIEHLRLDIEKGLHGTEKTAIRKAISQWSVIYRSYAMQRFDKASKGDGTWQPLSPATIAGRRKGKGKGPTAMILRDTGLLFKALSPGVIDAPGALTEDIPYGIRVGFGGPSRHGNGQATIADIAAFHNAGSGVPQRQIIVGPPDDVQAKMVEVLQKALQ